MKMNIKCLLVGLFVLIMISPVLANNVELVRQQEIENRINTCGIKILKANQIENKVTFTYSNENKKKELLDKTIFKRNVIVYKDVYKTIENEDELASYLARKIVFADRSYDGVMSGKLRSLQMKAAPKKFEIVADKIAVDYMIEAGYDPIALMVYINRTTPEKKSDLISTTNLTSKRLEAIYNYIYTKYPYYLVHSKYLDNTYYKDFISNTNTEIKTIEPSTVEKPRINLDYSRKNIDKVPIQLQVNEKITNEKNLEEGQTLEFEVVEDVIYEDELLVKQGENVTCRVETIITNGMNGIPASVILGNFKIPNLDSKKIDYNYEHFGRDWSLLVFPLKWALTPLPPTGSLTNFIKGGHVKLKPQSPITIYYYPN